jgi:K+-transporting ATPase ATPase C chain
MDSMISTSLRLFIILALLTGALYPLVVTAIGKGFFYKKASGSLIQKEGVVIGSSLIAQKFEADKYFWPRPSASDYKTVPSFGSNLGPISLELKKTVDARLAKYKETPPAEMLFASGSGLDPHISYKTAFSQAERIAKARGLTRRQVEEIIFKKIQNYLFLGPKVVNVLELNILLDELKK